MKRTCLRFIVVCAAIAAANWGCSTTNATSGQESAGGSDESATATESDQSESSDSEGDQTTEEAGGASASAGANQLPEGFEQPDGCPDIVEISLPEDEKSIQELRTWFCGRFEQTGTPSFEDAHSGTFTGACTLEQTQRQEAFRKVTRELSCYDGEGRNLAKLVLSDGEIDFVRHHEYDGGEEPVMSVSGNAENCSVFRRKGNISVTFQSKADGGMRLSMKQTYDDQGRLVEQESYGANGAVSVTRHEHEADDEKRVKTTYSGEQKQRETVEYLRGDGSVAREIKSIFSNGEVSFGSETRFDEQGRETRSGPLNPESKSSATVTSFEYRGDIEHPVSKKIVTMKNGEEASTVTVTYELDDDGEPLSSTITLPSGDTMEESWSYDDGKLVERHVFQGINPSGEMMRKEHIEIRYDDAGRPVYRHRWTGEKDGRTYAGHETEMTYECLE